MERSLQDIADIVVADLLTNGRGQRGSYLSIVSAKEGEQTYELGRWSEQALREHLIVILTNTGVTK